MHFPAWTVRMKTNHRYYNTFGKLGRFHHVRISDTVLDLEKHGKSLLREYRFLPNDSVTFINPGKRQLQTLEGLVWLTKEPCCVTLDDDPTEWRAKLACGHVVGKWYVCN